MMSSLAREKEIDQVWLALRVFPRREKHVMKLLQKKGIESWVPLQERTRRYKRKVRKVQLPLITQYVFIHTSIKKVGRALSVPGVIELVCPSGEIDPIPEEEIILMKRVVGEVSEIEVEPGKWQKGEEVEIVAGQLTGLKGHLVEWRGKQRLGIAMNQFQHTMIIEVPLHALRKV